MNNEMNSEMQPCPFCGGHEVEIRERTASSGVFSVSVMHWCKENGKPSLKPIERMGRTRDEAVRAWNKRA